MADLNTETMSDELDQSLPKDRAQCLVLTDEAQSEETIPLL